MVTAKATVVSPEDEQLRFWVRGDKGSFKKVRHPTYLGSMDNWFNIDMFASTTLISRRTNLRLVSCPRIRDMVVSLVSATVL